VNQQTQRSEYEQSLLQSPQDVYDEYGALCPQILHGRLNRLGVWLELDPERGIRVSSASGAHSGWMLWPVHPNALAYEIAAAESRTAFEDSQ
jgi:hypothetical protein